MLQTDYKTIHLDEVDSTNDFAKKLILEAHTAGRCVIVADRQTRGKGRLGRTWESPPDVGLWISLIIGPGIRHDQLALYNFMTSLTVCETLCKLSGLRFELKWPNDVLIREKKVCGILLETAAKNNELYLIAGIGVNVNQRTFPESLERTATSLFLETQKEWQRSDVLEAILTNFDKNCSNLNTEIFKRWKSMTTMLGKRISVIQDKTTFECTAKDIADDGALIVERNGKTDRLYAGDVHVRLN